MSVILRLGNLTVADLERRLGISFSPEHRKVLYTTRQENVSKPLAPRSWHYFDMPNEIVFGSYKFFCEFRSMLSSYDLSNGSVQASYELAEGEEVEDFYSFFNEHNLPNYLACKKVRLSDDGSTHTSHTFLRLKKENKVSLIYEELGTKFFNRDVLGAEGTFLTTDPIVPDESRVYINELRIKKDYLFSLYKGRFVHLDNQSWLPDTVRYYSIWQGERITDFNFSRELGFSLKSELKEYKEFRKIQSKKER